MDFMCLSSIYNMFGAYMLALTAKLIIFGFVLVVIFWDVAVLIADRPEVTISAVLLELTEEAPIIAFALGVVVGHLFWPNFKK